MALLKQDVTSTLGEIPESSRQSVFDTYDSIGRDLHSLLSDWQSGRTDLINILTPHQPPHDQSNTPEPPESIADSGLGISVDESNVPFSKRNSCGDWGPAFHDGVMGGPPELEDIDEEIAGEKVVEGLAVGRMAGMAITRAERIERAKREREESGERRRVEEEKGRWVGELKDVLGQRKR